MSKKERPEVKIIKGGRKQPNRSLAGIRLIAGGPKYPDPPQPGSDRVIVITHRSSPPPTDDPVADDGDGEDECEF